MSEKCSQHSNFVDRICLNKKCEDRLMCLLCQHEHQQFVSILTRKSENYKKFKTIINEAIDLYFLQKQTSIDAQILKKQYEELQVYFTKMKKIVNEYLTFVHNKCLGMLESDQEETMEILKSVRIYGTHNSVKPQLFQIFLNIYEGDSFKDQLENQNLLKTEEVQNYLSQVHSHLKKSMEETSFKLNIKIPDIKNIAIKNPEANPIQQNYSEEFIKMNNKIKAQLLFQSQVKFQSIISDCIKTNDYILASSYDKTLKVFDHSLNFLFEHQHQNIITKIKHIGQDVFAVGISKKLFIQRFSKQEVKPLIKLIGHTERINDISVYNSRILGTSSDQGTKVWDLYSQRCEYTFKQNVNPSALQMLPEIKAVAIGYNDHSIRTYSIQTLKTVRKWVLKGLPLMIRHEKLNQNLFYASSFPGNLYLLDNRFAKPIENFSIDGQAITCFNQCIFEPQTILLGQRDGKANIFNIRMGKVRYSWQAHSGKTNLSKPNGIVSIYEHSENSILTVGCNDRTLKIWEIVAEEKAQ